MHCTKKLIITGAIILWGGKYTISVRISKDPIIIISGLPHQLHTIAHLIMLLGKYMEHTFPQCSVPTIEGALDSMYIPTHTHFFFFFGSLIKIYIIVHPITEKVCRTQYKSVLGGQDILHTI